MNFDSTRIIVRYIYWQIGKIQQRFSQTPQYMNVNIPNFDWDVILEMNKTNEVCNLEM